MTPRALRLPAACLRLPAVWLCLPAAWLCLAAAPVRAEDAPGLVWPDPGASLALRRPFGDSEIVLRISARNAGAVDSLTWGGTEFLSSLDRGRGMQSASSFDGYGACHNPTEAGSDADGTGARSTSLLAGLRRGRAWLETETRMAWRLGPGRASPDCPRGPGPQTGARSDHTLRKRVAVGLPGIPNAIEVQASFDLPRAYESATFEALTASMPPAFTQSWTFEPKTGTLAPLARTDGEQGLPVILATPDGRRALGVWSPGLPQPGLDGSGYGRFGPATPPGAGNGAVRGTCVFRETAPAAGPHDYACYAVIGTLADVQAGIAALAGGPP